MHADASRTDLMSPAPKAPPPSGGFHHQPVLAEEVISLAPRQADLIVDCTVGGGGHAEALLRHFPQAELFGCDRDPQAIAAAGANLKNFGRRVLLKRIPFSELPHYLLAESADFMLADLGVSSPQLDDAGRGFSFIRDGPLDMRMNPESGRPTAGELINEAPAEDLLTWLNAYGEERFSSRIVEAVILARKECPFQSTGELARLVSSVIPARFHRKGFHPATRVFQALRIAVNDELGELEHLLDTALDLLKPGGRIAVISFHSLEDRMVKEKFRGWESPCQCPSHMPVCICGKTPLGCRLTRKPLAASAEEASANPRSRSAKLRAFEKLHA